MDRDEVEGAKWDAWNRALAGIAGILAVGGRRDDGTLGRLYELAVELRERLRHSQGRVRGLKQELSVTVAAARSERHEAMARLQELETEVARLAGAVQAQGSTLAARETVSQSQAAENEQLRRHIAGLERQLKRCEEDRGVTITERNEALRHLDRMSRLLEESEVRVAEVQAEHSNLLGELVTTKGRLSDLSALETLYGAARDELQRLDKENLELKDMVAAGGITLGRSRILEALGVPETSAAATGGGEGGATLRGGSRRSGSGSSPRVPLLGYGAVHGHGHGLGGGGSPGVSAGLAALGGLTGPGGGGGGRSRSAPRARGGSSLPSGHTAPRSLSPPAAGRMLQLSPSGAASQSYSHSHSHSQSYSLEDPVSEMAFLGPPSAAYPPDPENYLFYRVGGGYEARLNIAQPTIPQPRASGWVPKDVVRLVQAFRHSYGLSLEWRFWEPLVLLIDEVYRNRADCTLAAMKAAQQERLKAVKRQVRAALGYPSAVANGKINHLQRQLNSARKILALSDRKGEQSLRQMAMKDYHLGYQLDRAVEENYALRRSLHDLEYMYSNAMEGAVANKTAAVATASGGPPVGNSGGMERRRSLAADASASPSGGVIGGGGGGPYSSPRSGAAAPGLRNSTSDLYAASGLHSPHRISSSAVSHSQSPSQFISISPKRPHEHDLDHPHSQSYRGSDRYGGSGSPHPHLDAQRIRPSQPSLPHYQHQQQPLREAEDGFSSRRTSLHQVHSQPYSDHPSHHPQKQQQQQNLRRSQSLRHSGSHDGPTAPRASEGTLSRRTSVSAVPGSPGAGAEGANSL